MKKLIICLVLWSFAFPALADYDQTVRYEFFHGEYGIWIPDSFFVIHENITEEELSGTDSSPEEAFGFLNAYSMDLYASFDQDNGYLSIQVFEDAVSGEIAYEGLSDAEYLGEFWADQLESKNYIVLFSEPYVTEYDCFGKVAYMFESDGKPVYCVDFITVLEKDLISLSFISYAGQFDIEDNYIINTIASSLHDNIVTVSQGT